MIINADDFGRSEVINHAIVRSFADGLISSTTLMANMPGFEHACQLARDHALQGHIGVHLSLDAGIPLTDGIKRQALFCDIEGRLRRHRPAELMRLDAKQRDALGEEIAAQIDRVRKHGIEPTHADSHHHLHTRWAVGTVLTRVASRLRVPHVRIARNAAPGGNPVARVYKALYNARLRRAGLAKTRYFGSIEDYRWAHEPRRAAVALDAAEIMVHPVLDNANRVIDCNRGSPDEKLGPLLSEAVQTIAGYERAVSYADLRYDGAHRGALR